MKKPVAILASLFITAVLALPAIAHDMPDDMDGPDQGMAAMEGMRGDRDSRGDSPMMTMPHMRRTCRTPGSYIRLADDLGLSDAQLESLGRLDSSLRKEAVLKGASVKVMEMELSDIVADVDFKLDAALAKLGDIEKARTDLRKAVITSSSKARDVLTVEQKDRLKEMDLRRPMAGQAGGMHRPGPGMTEDDKRMMMEKMRREKMQENMP